ncbi:hypothetical protein K435DRAFT_864683 [Dendrothele bispora CBS 962.96]|uniref:Uncharacterized protein n=1 Tax=Dendrothele bispora (strain CBS 962.96) TaxID=1314807 RepID=A0A4S8LL89_DENBC|nr:hypothetical protein K435DRAFT_864683 [Dendrothele bispora CBS 962.96]
MPDSAVVSSTVVSFPTTEETQSHADTFDESSSRDEDATKAFDQSMLWETPEAFLHPPVMCSSPPIAILPEEKDEDDHGHGNDDDEDEQGVEEDLVNEIDSSPIRPSTTH